MARIGCGETVPPKETLLAMYRTMLTIRMFEESISEAFARGLIPGFIHLCIGQEATAAGTGANLRADDYIISTHRGHGHCIAKGADVRLMAAEIFGRATGYCKGRGGSMHVAAPALGILGANGIVGGGLPIINGAALSAQMRGTDQVAVCFFGEGASNEGTFHEAVNLAAVWKLPVVFLCETNGYAEFTPMSTHMAVKSVAVRAAAYGIEGLTVDGNDVLQVYEGVRCAVERARRGEGPSIVEGLTHRWHGHYEGDPQKYRRPEELEKCKGRDPIVGFAEWLAGQGILDAASQKQVRMDVKKEIDAALQYAQDSPPPSPEEALQEVYA